MSSLMLTQIISTSIMTGVIWVIQLVHYPSFRFIDSTRFVDFQRFHQRSITWIVLPTMMVELCSGILILVTQNLSPLSISNISSITLIWLATYFFSVPCHSALEKEFNGKVVEKLIQTNWIRTVLWTLRTFMLFRYS